MSWRLYRTFCLALIAVALAGCVHQRAHSIWRVWADWNTFAQPALFAEQIDHMPYRAARVGEFRWLYGFDPGHGYKDPLMNSGAVNVPVKSHGSAPIGYQHEDGAELAPPPTELESLPPLPNADEAPTAPETSPGLPRSKGSGSAPAKSEAPNVPPLPTAYPEWPSANAVGRGRQASNGRWLWRAAHADRDP